MALFSGQRLFDRKIYWRMRKHINRFHFILQSKSYSFKDRAKKNALDTLTLSYTLKATLNSLVIACFISAALYGVNTLLASPLNDAGWKVQDDGDYVTFLASVAGIGGVFIGLYYAALTSVGSAIYAKVPGSIRDLLARERSGSVYMRYLSMLTLLCVTLIACRVVGLPRIIVAVPFIALLAGAGIVAFVMLGRSAFNLFDPTALSYHVFEEFNKAILITMPGSPHWSASAFQHHAYKLANHSIETLRLLIDITMKETHQNGRPLTQLTCHVLLFLTAYENLKRKIPSDSHWYPQQYKHRDWYATPGHRVMIAHRTGTKLQPDMTRSLHWVEQKLHADLFRTFTMAIAQARHADVIQLISHLESYIKANVTNGNFSDAFGLVERASKTIIEAINDSSKKSLHLTDLERLSIIESVASLPITIALALTKYLEHTSIQKLAKSLANVNWSAKETLYNINLPTYLVQQGEWLFTRLSMEFRSEGRVISPVWYQNDILNLAFSKSLAELIVSFPRRSCAFYKNFSDSFSSHETRWLKACVQSSEYEFWHKAERTQQELNTSWLSSNESRVLSDLPWPLLKVNELESEIAKHKKELILSIAQQSYLLLSERIEDFPDYPGQFSFIIGEAFLQALCENDDTLSNSIFHTYMLSCITRFENLRPPSGTTAGVEDSFRTAAACLLDLIELSGYALLLAEFHGNKALWEPVKAAWSALSTGASRDTIMAYLSLVTNLNNNGFGLPLRAELRFEWERVILDLFRDLEIEEIIEHRGISVAHRFVHPSALIQSLDFSHFERLPSGYDLFIVSWYVNAIKPNVFKLNWKQERLLKTINLVNSGSESIGD